MAEKRCYYEILGVSREVDGHHLKKAFRKLALEFHPDRNPSEEAAEKFREAQEAYEVLNDPEKRQIYNQLGHAGLEGRIHRGGFGNMEDIFEGFSSIFEDFFGGGATSRQRKGRDLRYRLEIEFEEAVLGTQKKISIQRPEICETCEGEGSAPGHSKKACALCGGRGKIRQQQGFFVVQQTCPDCRGAGEMVTNPCADCRGQGVRSKETELDVNIPPGVDSGVRLRLAGEGEALPGGQRGDLYVEIEVKAHEFFERDGSDLYVRLHVPYRDAVLGGEIDVPLIQGHKRIKVPKNLKTPHMETLRGEGVADLRSGRRGQLFVEMNIATPTKLSKKAKALLEELQKEISQDEPLKREAQDASLRSPFQKFREAFGFS